MSLKDALSEMIGAGEDRGVVYAGAATTSGEKRGSLTIDSIRKLSHRAEVENLTGNDA
jgi:hypothetical protein